MLSDDNEFNITGTSNKIEEVEEVEVETIVQNPTNNKSVNNANVIISEPKTQENNNNQNSGFIPSNGVVINILLKDKRTAQLILPNDAMSGDLDTIINWIRLMKESF